MTRYLEQKLSEDIVYSSFPEHKNEKLFVSIHPKVMNRILIRLKRTGFKVDVGLEYNRNKNLYLIRRLGLAIETSDDRDHPKYSQLVLHTTSIQGMSRLIDILSLPAKRRALDTLKID